MPPTCQRSLHRARLPAISDFQDTKNVGHLMDELKTAATKPVGSYPANRYGLYDMVGNVGNWHRLLQPVHTIQASYNPAGPLRGLARVIRGGSFISTTSSSWAKGYHSSMDLPTTRAASRASVFAAPVSRRRASGGRSRCEVVRALSPAARRL